MAVEHRVPPVDASQGESRSSFSRLLPRLLGWVERWDIAWVVVLLNLAGFLAGIIFWYGEQLLQAAGQWFLWPFIPDCPLFAGLFVIAFLGLRAGRDWHLFYTATALGLIKYGVWTVVFSLAYWAAGAVLEPLSLAMCLTHVGMILEGVYVCYRILSPVSRGTPPGFRQRDVFIATAWFLLSDLVDYGLGHYPQFDPEMAPLPLIQWHTIFMTVALAAVFFVLSRRRSPGGLGGRIVWQTSAREPTEPAVGNEPSPDPALHHPRTIRRQTWPLTPRPRRCEICGSRPALEAGQHASNASTPGAS